MESKEMIYHRVEQRSEEWFRLRLGIPTASEFKRILTPGGKISAQSPAYLNRLLAEWITGRQMDEAETEWMIRGQELEDDAVRAYEFASDVETQAGGFWTTDDGLIGASPDRLVGSDALLEIKCPKESTHIGYMLSRTVEEDYRPQLQGQLWVTGRKRVDVCCYCPGLPLIVLPVKRDAEYIAHMEAALGTFTTLMLEFRSQLTREYGLEQYRVPAPLPVEEVEGVSAADVEAILADQEARK